MTIYSISGFSFNIGSTTISQEYVPLVKEDVPWGINSTYIYKARTLRDQFDVNNKHLVIENKCVGGNIIFKTKGTEKIIITDLSVGTINGLPYSGSGSGVGLTANSVNSSHIQNGSILGADISEGTITSYNILDGTILGTDISGATITDANIAEGTITEAKLVSAVQTKLNAVGVRGVFEISNSGSSSGSISVSCKCRNLNDSDWVYLFEDIPISVGETEYIPYTLPPFYGSKRFQLIVEGNGYNLSNYSIGDSGLISDSTDNNRILFNINRNNAINLEILNILVQ